MRQCRTMNTVFQEKSDRLLLLRFTSDAFEAGFTHLSLAYQGNYLNISLLLAKVQYSLHHFPQETRDAEPIFDPRLQCFSST